MLNSSFNQAQIKGEKSQKLYSLKDNLQVKFEKVSNMIYSCMNLNLKTA